MRLNPAAIRRYFIIGLLIWVPLVITIWVLLQFGFDAIWAFSLMVDLVDQSLHLLPSAAHPKNLFGFDLPGLSTALTLLMLFLTGVLGARILGKRFVVWRERLLARIPVINLLYKVSDTLLAQDAQTFRKALLVQYPHQGLWTVAFMTKESVAAHLPEEHLCILVPTAPVPASGFFLMLPKREATELDISVDKALQYAISMGVGIPSESHSQRIAQET